MAEEEYLGDADLDNEKISNLLGDRNRTRKLSDKLAVIDKLGNEYYNKKTKEKDELLLKKKKEQMEIEKNKCENYLYVFTIFLIQSLISLGCFYIFYKLKFTIKDNTIYLIVLISILFFLILSACLINFSIKSDFNFNHQKCCNFFIFIIINIHKIIIEVCVYLLLVRHEIDNQLDFPHFEARAYWKIAMSILYLALIFFYYFQKDKSSLKFFFVLIFSFISLAIYFLLVFFTEKKDISSERIWGYFILMLNEISLLVISASIDYKNKQIYEFFDIEIDWKVNRIDFLRNGIIFISLIWALIKNCRIKCCKTA